MIIAILVISIIIYWLMVFSKKTHNPCSWKREKLLFIAWEIIIFLLTTIAAMWVVIISQLLIELFNY
jgi:hypothetical protein